MIYEQGADLRSGDSRGTWNGKTEAGKAVDYREVGIELRVGRETRNEIHAPMEALSKRKGIGAKWRFRGVRGLVSKTKVASTSDMENSGMEVLSIEFGA